MKGAFNVSVVAFATIALLASRPIQTPGPQESILHDFYIGADGNYPFSILTFDSGGNLYGTTSAGGGGVCDHCGTVFRLSRQLNGHWSEKVLYSFGGAPADGDTPVAGLTFDSAGNLYGITSHGGAEGAGTVFELSPQPGGDWSESVLYSFQNNGADGEVPQASLIFDGVGDLYGTTFTGGTGGCNTSFGIGCGTVFELSPQSGGWSETVLHSFQNSPDGAIPSYGGGLVFDEVGNIYGTTIAGGVGGTVFELSPQAGGAWSETILYDFGGGPTDGAGPYQGLIFDSLGNLYGTTFGGGVGEGTVFELSPQSNGSWTETILHNFRGGRTDGSGPNGGLIFDNAGNMYGTTAGGGSKQGAGDGTVFVLLRKKAWAERVFSFNKSDGKNPYATVTIDQRGNLYGTTEVGGTFGAGTVFEIRP